jgi:hypothetical protein
MDASLFKRANGFWPNWAVKRTPTLAMASVGALRPGGLRRRLPWALGPPIYVRTEAPKARPH